MISLAVRRLALATEVSRLGGAPVLTDCLVNDVHRLFGAGTRIWMRTEDNSVSCR